MKIFGLTGGIASGKSAVAAGLRQLNVPVLDADQLYHTLIAPQSGQPSPLAIKVGEAFPGTLLADGNLNRAELGKLVFGDSIARQRLNQLTHPAVAAEFKRQLAVLENQGESRVFYDVPLLFEANKEREFAAVVVVWVPEKVQLERLISRDSLTMDDAKARVASQLSLDEKKARADFVIDNSGNLEQTINQLIQLLTQLS